MKRLTAAQRRRQEAELARLTAEIEAAEAAEAAERAAPRVISSRPRPYLTLSLPVRGIFQDAYGQNEIHIPYDPEQP